MIYLATPYTVSGTASPKQMEQHFAACAICTARLMREQSQLIYAPILHGRPIEVYGGAPATWEYWRSYDKQWIRQCHEVYVLARPGWRESVGVQDEIDFAISLDKQVRILPAYYGDLLS